MITMCDHVTTGYFSTYTSIVVTVDHDGGAAIQVDVQLPPVCDVVGSPPRL